MKIKSILLILVITISMVVFVNLELSASTTSILIPTLISDHQATSANGSIYYLDAKSTQNAVHIAWAEPTTTTFPYDYDIFYRQLPNGSTIDLSRNVQTLGQAGPVLIQPSTGDDVCVLWREAIPSGDYYLFLWRSASNTTKRSPNPVEGGSPLTFSPFICNGEEDAKIAWISTTNVSYSWSEVFFWDEASNTQIKLSNDEDGETRHFQRVDVNEITYLAWNEPESNASAIYLWDSSSNMVQQLASDGYLGQLLKDKNNKVYLFWSWSPPMGPACNYYWNSQTQVSNLIMDCDGDWAFAVVNDGVGNVHSTWHKGIGPTPIHYWNLTENITATAQIPNQAVRNMNLLGGPDDKAHIFWQDFVTNALYYWNSNTLGETLVTPASFYIQNALTWDFDSNGAIHTVWRDSLTDVNNTDVSYWTPSLTSPITLTESALIYPIFDLVVDSQDVAHVAFSGQPDTLLHYWNNQTNQVKTVSNETVLINSPINLVADLSDEIFAFYSSTPDSHYYWGSENGEAYLGSGGQVTPILDNMNNLYVYWIASEDLISEGQDVHAAWSPNFNYWVYLPVVLK